MEGALGFPQLSVPFDALAELRDLARQILDRADQSLLLFRRPSPDGKQFAGYVHRYSHQGHDESNEPFELSKFNKTSTATALRYENARGTLADSLDSVQDFFDLMLDKATIWQSAGLPPDNHYTTAFMLELAGNLCDQRPSIDVSEQAVSRIVERLKGLRCALLEARNSGDTGAIAGSIAIGKSGLPKAYLTQLVVRVLHSWDHRLNHCECTSLDESYPLPESVREQLDLPDAMLDDEARYLTRQWSMSVVDTEIALAMSEPREFDVYELGYAVLLVLELSTPSLPASPIERRRLEKALELVFDAQSIDGSWPRGKPLFQYPDHGNAYCFEYEFLTQLLERIDDPLLLWPYLEHFRRAIDRLGRESIPLPDGGVSWISGHHPQLSTPESWSTASCFHFVHLLDRLVANAAHKKILQYLGTRPISTTVSKNSSKWESILDSEFKTEDGETHSLKCVLERKMIERVESDLGRVRKGQRFGHDVPLSAILFGPPGNSKTDYVSAISARIGWPQISIDPSHLLRNGIADLLAETTKVFVMLNYVDNVVVFFDEIDELVRTRTDPDSESTSRLFTTAMLPKIATLLEGKQVLFFVATNHVEVIDAAISRPGRFDLILPVMPPTTSEKTKLWQSGDRLKRCIRVDDSELKTVTDTLGLLDLDREHESRRIGDLLADLAFKEFVHLTSELAKWVLSAALGAETDLPQASSDPPPESSVSSAQSKFEELLISEYGSCNLNSAIRVASDVARDGTWRDLMESAQKQIRI